MGYAQALFEEMRYDNGVLVNGEALEYRVPMAEDLPGQFVSITQEQGHGPGPFGSKGAGEGPMVPVAAAVANAVHDAVGARVRTLPLTPERVFHALRESAAAPRGDPAPRHPDPPWSGPSACPGHAKCPFPSVSFPAVNSKHLHIEYLDNSS